MEARSITPPGTIARTAAVVAAIGVLASCAVDATPEQEAELDRIYGPVVAAALPACIAKASGRNADYSALHRLGLSQRSSFYGQGEFLYPTGKGSMFDKDGIRFATGEGCYAQTTVVAGLAGPSSLGPLGRLWTRALQNAGYRDTGASPSEFNFTANGVPMRFYGQYSSDAGYTVMAIVRDD